MSLKQNDIYLEQQHEAFEEFIAHNYWKSAREVVKEVEDNGFNVEEWRREMNAAMDKAYVPDAPMSEDLKRMEQNSLNAIAER